MILSEPRIEKVLIRLRGCAGWSAPLLFANHRKQVFSRRGPLMIYLQTDRTKLGAVFCTVCHRVDMQTSKWGSSTNRIATVAISDTCMWKEIHVHVCEQIWIFILLWPLPTSFGSIKHIVLGMSLKSEREQFEQFWISMLRDEIYQFDFKMVVMETILDQFQCLFNASHKILVQSDIRFCGSCRLEIFKMAFTTVLFDIEMNWM